MDQFIVNLGEEDGKLALATGKVNQASAKEHQNKMVQRMNISRFGQYGLGSVNNVSSTCDKRQPIAARKIVLRDVQNVNALVVPKARHSLTDRNTKPDYAKISGIKRPSESSGSPHHLSPSSSLQGHIVYARRKVDGEATRTYENSDIICKQQEKESEVFIGMATSWEERTFQLKALLRTLEESSQEDYIRMLRSLSSVELSRHAVELEKRAIQLALEEGRAMESVHALNVLQRAAKGIGFFKA